MMKTNTSPRLFVDDALKAESALVLDPAQAHYLGHVMRLRVGDAVRLFNGRDGEWTAAIEKLKKSRGLSQITDFLGLSWDLCARAGLADINKTA